MSEVTEAKTQGKSKSKFSIQEICYVGLFTAVIAVMAQISIPMPMGVPMTMQTFAITLAAVVLGAKLSTISCVVYLLLIIGFGVEHRKAFKGAFVVALVAGTVVNYVVGVVMFCLLTHSSVMVGITACVLPFIPTAIIKAVLASIIGFAVRRAVPGIRK